MAKQLYFVSGGEFRAAKSRMLEIESRLMQKGTTLSPQFLLDRLQELVEAGEESPQPSKRKSTFLPSLVKGLFTPTHIKLENVRRWNEQRNWGFTEADFANLPAPPSYPKNQFGTVVLVPYLETPLKTYQELVAIMRYEHWESDGGAFSLMFDRLEVCGAPHEPGLRWEVIDMGGGRNWHKQTGTNFQGYPLVFPPPELMPHAGVLAEIAHSPYWARSLYSYNGVPGVWIPGYMTIPNEKDMAPSWIESGEYLKPSFGKHVFIESFSYWASHQYLDHKDGWMSNSEYMREGQLSRYAIPVLIK